MDLGVAYYPEHWPEDRWATDARLMREAGIRRVRLAEFAWQLLEPREGRYVFDWLERAIRTLERERIGIILCTPTPTYPPWLHRRYPDLHQVRSDGQVKEFGQRQDACKNHPGYRAAARRIAAQVVKRFGQDPAVVAWQTDNELGCHGTARCFCAHCEAAFQRWLRDRYAGDIERVNRAWGTVFWSQGYGDFTEISLPRDTADNTGMAGQNPGLLMDFHRFCSDTQVRFQAEQIELIRRHSPGRPVTHNFMGNFHHIDYFDLARDLDLVSWDNYPFRAAGTGRPPEILPLSLMHGLKDANVWVMEQASGPGGWGVFAATPRPGEMRLWSYQAVSRGADMVSFFRWRTARFGREQYWHGILYHHGQPQWRYREVQRMGAEMERLGPRLEGTRPVTGVGLLFDYTSCWALEAQPQVAPAPPPPAPSAADPHEAPPPVYGYTEMSAQWLRVLAEMGVAAAVLSADRDLARYPAILAPTLHVLPPGLAERLESYVRGGGVLILGPRSGVRDEHGAITDLLLPGALRGVAGLTVQDYDLFTARTGGPRSWSVRDTAGGTHRAHVLAELLAPEEGAEAILSWADGGPLYAGNAAAVSHRLGAGTCVYVGTVLDNPGLAWLFRAYVPACAGRAALPPGLEVVRRERPDGAGVTFYLNHTEAPMRVDLSGPGTDLLGDRSVDRVLELEPFGVAAVAPG